MNEDELRWALAARQHHFGKQIANFRRFYESYSPGIRADLRSWLEKVEIVVKEGERWGLLLSVKSEKCACDRSGVFVRWEGVDLSLTTLLLAIRAWDAGYDFAATDELP